jgi:hypothetical protein
MAHHGCIDRIIQMAGGEVGEKGRGREDAVVVTVLTVWYSSTPPEPSSPSEWTRLPQGRKESMCRFSSLFFVHVS